MSLAAQEALALRECLATGTHQLAQRFFKQASSVADIAWSITVGNSLSLSDAEGSQPPTLRFINWYMRKLQIAAQHDPQLAFAFQQVANLIAAPASLVQPRIALRVLWGNLRSARQAKPLQPDRNRVRNPSHP